MKKCLMLLAFAALLGWNVSAKEAHRHVISFGPAGIIGGAVCYEYMLLPNLSLLIDTGLSFSFFGVAYDAALHTRWYPFSNSEGKPLGVFASGGIGYGGIIGWGSESEGLLLSTGIGYKIGAGRPRGFVFTPLLNINVILGNKTTTHDYDSDTPSWQETKFGVGVFPDFKLLFGWAF